MSSENIELIVSGKDNNATGVLDSVQTSAGGLGKLMKTGLAVGAGVAVAGIGALAAVLGSSVKEAMAAEDIQAQLGAVLKSTGGAAGVSAQMANDLATSLSGVTRFEDDAIVSGENMLLTFTNIGKDVFPMATETMLNMSQALGQDLQSSAIQLGKALNDPIAGVSALQRVGVTFTEAQKEQIKTLVESGDVMGAQKVILAELGKEFGGAAQAAGGTFAGQMDILKNRLGNVKESIGNALLPILTDLAQKMGPGIVAAAEKFASWLTSKGIPAMQAFGNWIVANVIPALQKLGGWIQTNVIPALQTFGAFLISPVLPALQAFGNWIQNNVVPALIAIGQWISTNVVPALQQMGDFIATNVIPALQTFGNWIQTNVLPALQAFGEFIVTKVFPALQQMGQFIQTYIVPVLIVLANFISTTLKLAFEIIMTVWEVSIKPALQALWSFIETYVVPVLKKLADFIRVNVGPAFQWLNANVIQPIVSTIKSFAEKIETAITWLQNIRKELEISFPDPFAAIAETVQGVIRWINDLITKIREALIEMAKLNPFSKKGDGGNDGGGANSDLRNLGANSGGRGMYGGMAPITIHVHAAGGSPDVVRRAANQGALEALRAGGYR